MPLSHPRVLDRFAEEFGVGPNASCAECGKAMIAIRSTAVYCSDGCRQRAHRARRRKVA